MCLYEKLCVCIRVGYSRICPQMHVYVRRRDVVLHVYKNIVILYTCNKTHIYIQLCLYMILTSVRIQNVLCLYTN